MWAALGAFAFCTVAFVIARWDAWFPPYENPSPRAKPIDIPPRKWDVEG